MKAPKSTAATTGLLRTWEGRVEAAALAANPAPRADVFLAEIEGLLSRSQIKARNATIRVNGKLVKASRILKAGDRVELSWSEEPSMALAPESLPLAVLHEDGRCLVVDKAQGMVTHPGHGNHRGTLANAVLGRLEAGAPVATSFDGRRAPPARAGIVHRLDKDTSGVIIVAKDAEAQAFLAAQFKQRTTRKEYVAIVHGLPAPLAGRIADQLGRSRRDRKLFASLPEGGKAAVTDYRVLALWPAAPEQEGQGDAYALVLLRPRTGRTHQLRVHMAGLGAPIVGDPLYGKPDRRFPGATLMLHAYRLRITLPGGDAPSLFRAPLPERLKRLIVDLDSAFGRAGRGAVGFVPGDRPEK